MLLYNNFIPFINDLSSTVFLYILLYVTIFVMIYNDYKHINIKLCDMHHHTVDIYNY